MSRTLVGDRACNSDEFAFFDLSIESHPLSNRGVGIRAVAGAEHGPVD